jgi:uncharacterized SAM-dependent methyltransferase
LKKIELITRDELESRFWECLNERQMPDHFLYLDSYGARNWLTLDRSAEFTVAAGLSVLLEQSLDSIAGHVPGRLDVFSIGVGSGEKERMLLQALLPRCRPSYYAVDVSSQMVDEALYAAADLDIDKTGIVAFLEDLPSLKEFWHRPVLLCLLGNNFCNYEPDCLLKTVAGQLEPGDLFLFDCHLLPQSSPAKGSGQAQVERTYRSPLNVHFNIDPLVRRGLKWGNCTFHLELLPAETDRGKVYRTSKRLEILKDSVIADGHHEVLLAAGETIRLGFTYKYTAAQVEEYLKRHGFQVVERYLSPDGNNLLALAGKPPEHVK